MRDVPTALHPATEALTSADPVVRTRGRQGRGASLAVSCALLGTEFLGGTILALSPGQNGLDSWGFSVFSSRLQDVFLRAVSDLGLAPVTAGFALAAAAWIWRRDRRRTLACLAGPALAIGLAELLKLVVGRRFDGALCWPSGTAAAVAAVATAIVLVTRGRVRVVAIVVGSAVVMLEVVALVAFRWHYLSDALGGVVLGIGCILFVDAVLHRLHGRRRRSHRPRRTAPPQVPVMIHLHHSPGPPPARKRP